MSVKANAYWDGTQLRLVDPKGYTASLQALDPGAGESFVVLVMREVEAKQHHQLKWYYGYCVKQACDKTGYTAIEMDTIYRTNCLAYDVDTISLMSFDQMATYIHEVERYAADVIGVVIAGPDDARHWKAA